MPRCHPSGQNRKAVATQSWRLLRPPGFGGKYDRLVNATNQPPFERMTVDYLEPQVDDAPAVAAAATAVAATSPGDALRALASGGFLDLPLPASGQTWSRLRRLAEIAAVDLSLGRLAEGHTDAVAILAEAQVDHDPAALHGVWAANGDVAIRPGTSTMVLHGQREYCSGAGVLDRALITAIDPEGNDLLTVANLWNAGVHIQPETWLAVGMADSLSSTVQFHTVPAQIVGGPGFYTRRPGFWRGSVNVAAVWYGGALGLARAVRPRLQDAGVHGNRQAAELHIAISTMRLLLQQAAAEMDARCEPEGGAFARAMLVRHVIFDGCLAAIRLASDIGGTGLATHDRFQARRLADLPVYLQQHHPDRDLRALGESLARQNGALR